MGKKTNVLNLRSQVSPQQWQNQWGQLHNAHFFRRNQEILNFLTRLFKDFYLNRVFIRQTHKGFFIKIELVGVYPKTPSLNLKNLASCIQVYTQTPHMDISISVVYLPKTLIGLEERRTFRSFKRDPYFWPSLLLIKGAFGGHVSAYTLACFLNLYLKRNRRRRRFVDYIKTLLDYQVENKKNWQIKGMRIEVKGRLAPKLRTARHIMSCGAISLQTLKSHLDYGQVESYTILGSIGIKVWICSNVVATETNKI